jgi:inorganic pyrophosphatase
VTLASILEIAPRAPGGLINVIIDTPLGSCNKYKIDAQSGLFKLSHMLPAGLHFPCDFGSIPGTLAEDGDALDVVVLSSAPSFVGCLMQAKLIGVIGAVQKEGRRRLRNDRLVAVPVTPVNSPAYRDILKVPEDRIGEIAQFFVTYNRAQGREFHLTGLRGPAAAERTLRAAIKSPRLGVRDRPS